MKNKNVKLIEPNAAYLQSYLEACRENKRQDGGKFSAAFRDPDNFAQWKDSVAADAQAQREGRNLPEGYVPCSVFWLVADAEFIGVGHIRHALTPALERFGGHIGYAIRPSKRGQGYGTVQLTLLLAEAARLGIAEALVTCDDDNIGSYRVMEKNGGRHLDTIENIIDGSPKRTRRYLIPTAPDGE